MVGFLALGGACAGSARGSPGRDRDSPGGAQARAVPRITGPISHFAVRHADLRGADGPSPGDRGGTRKRAGDVNRSGPAGSMRARSEDRVYGPAGGADRGAVPAAPAGSGDPELELPAREAPDVAGQVVGDIQPPAPTRLDPGLTRKGCAAPIGLAQRPDCSPPWLMPFCQRAGACGKAVARKPLPRRSRIPGCSQQKKRPCTSSDRKRSTRSPR